MVNRSFTYRTLQPEQFREGLETVDLELDEFCELTGVPLERAAAWCTGSATDIPPWVGALLGALTVKAVRDWADDVLAEAPELPDGWISRALNDAGISARQWAWITGMREDAAIGAADGKHPEKHRKPWMHALLGAMTVPRARRIVLAYAQHCARPILEPEQTP